MGGSKCNSIPCEAERSLTVCKVVFPGVTPHQHGNSQPPLVLSISCTRVCLSPAVSVGAGVSVGGAGVKVGDAVAVGGKGLGVRVGVSVGGKGVMLAEGVTVGNGVPATLMGTGGTLQLTRNISAMHTPNANGR